MADDLFSVALTVRGEGALRRFVTDGSVPTEAKTGLVGEVFGGKVGDGALKVLTAARRPPLDGRPATWPTRSSTSASWPRSAPPAATPAAWPTSCSPSARPSRTTRSCATRSPTRRGPPTTRPVLLDRLLGGKALPATVALVKQALSAATAPSARRWPSTRRSPPRSTARAWPPSASPDRSPTPSCSGSPTCWPASTTARSTSTSWSTPRSSAGSASRSATTSSTAPSSSRLDDARRRLAG